LSELTLLMIGNTHESQAFAQVIKEYVYCLKATQETQYFVDDVTLYFLCDIELSTLE